MRPATPLERAQALETAAECRAAGQSERAVAARLGRPRSTLRGWAQSDATPAEVPGALAAFIASEEGVRWRHRRVLAMQFVLTLRAGGGVRWLCECLELSGLSAFVGASYGSQQGLNAALEQAVVAIATEQRAAVAADMAPRAVTVCEDVSSAARGRQGDRPGAGACGARSQAGVSRATPRPRTAAGVCAAHARGTRHPGPGHRGARSSAGPPTRGTRADPRHRRGVSPRRPRTRRDATARALGRSPEGDLAATRRDRQGGRPASTGVGACGQTLLATLAFFFATVRQRVAALSLSPDIAAAVLGQPIPALYIERVAARSNCAKARTRRHALSALTLKPLLEPQHPIQALDIETRAHIEQVPGHCADLFQRSSSAVEGRNAQLSLHHHGRHRLSERKLAALTAGHNFHIRRPDSTTAAQRFVGRAPPPLFEQIIARVPLPPRPRRPPPPRPKVPCLTPLAA